MKPTRTSRYPEGYFAKVRSWAHDNDVAVPTVGVVQKAVIDQYEAAIAVAE